MYETTLTGINEDQFSNIHVTVLFKFPLLLTLTGICLIHSNTLITPTIIMCGKLSSSYEVVLRIETLLFYNYETVKTNIYISSHSSCCDVLYKIHEDKLSRTYKTSNIHVLQRACVKPQQFRHFRMFELLRDMFQLNFILLCENCYASTETKFACRKQYVSVQLSNWITPMLSHTQR